ncbi:hypothetical protein OL239_08620 [Arthrobacter sp. ATA002]|uniref:hypothetical protein n=1 Tax=Arthrobacter sp. ATA002 TaxID=2991715 RepID=UPI0022A7E64B|nr:hypothetical protein [Arthrobacter sp. ATA002]WAP53110.1 hypothetical protein OL239_08620 [Arthrobacter sp. ATA002]
MKFAELDQRVWRVGFLPQPSEWSGWRWAGPDGRFNSRWDPLDHGLYRTVYAADSLSACLVELLAPHRPDPYLVAEIDDIVEDDSDAEQFLSASPGELEIDQWLPTALTSATESQFRSRHGDDLLLRAVYERDTDGQTSAHITGIELEDLSSDTLSSVLPCPCWGSPPAERAAWCTARAINDVVSPLNRGRRKYQGYALKCGVTIALPLGCPPWRVVEQLELFPVRCAGLAICYLCPGGDRARTSFRT